MNNNSTIKTEQEEVRNGYNHILRVPKKSPAFHIHMPPVNCRYSREVNQAQKELVLELRKSSMKCGLRANIYEYETVTKLEIFLKTFQCFVFEQRYAHTTFNKGIKKDLPSVNEVCYFSVTLVSLQR